MINNETTNILGEIEIVKHIYVELIKILPSFDITDKQILPYGLKTHTRSVSWLVEQVITQQTKFRCDELNLDFVNFDLPDTCLHDCEITKGGKKLFINIKIHNMGGKENKNDIAAVEKLFMQYTSNQNYNLIYACFGIRFQGINISFDKDYLKIFSAQFLPIYVNPRNDKIQAFYHHNFEIRTREEFVKLLREKSMSIRL